MARSLWLLAVLVGLFWASSARAIENAAEIQISKIATATGSRIGVAAIDQKSGQRVNHLSKERFPLCSTFKVLAVAAILQRVDQGHEKLDRFISYTEKDLLEYAPVTREHVREGGMSLEALCAAAIKQSDNTAANLLLRTIDGPAGVTEFARSLGDDVTRLDRNEPDLNEWQPGDERDTTSPLAMCEDVRRLLTTSILSQVSRDRLRGWLEANETGAAMIHAGVPKGWRVGDKTGRSGTGATNDVAVVYPPDDSPIFIAIYVFNPSASDEQRFATISNVARIVCESFRPAR